MECRYLAFQQAMPASARAVFSAAKSFAFCARLFPWEEAMSAAIWFQ
jgi:hypothetical protein